MNLRLRSAIIALTVVILDRLSKLYINRAYATWDVTVVIPRVFNIVHAENPGAAFSMLAGAPPLVRAVLLVGVSVIVMTGVGVMLWRLPKNAHWLMPTSLALAGERIRGNPGALFGVLLTVAQVGGIVLPASIGLVAEQTSVRLGLSLLVVSFGAITLIVRRVMRDG